MKVFELLYIILDMKTIQHLQSIKSTTTLYCVKNKLLDKVSLHEFGSHGNMKFLQSIQEQFTGAGNLLICC